MTIAPIFSQKVDLKRFETSVLLQLIGRLYVGYFTNSFKVMRLLNLLAQFMQRIVEDFKQALVNIPSITSSSLYLRTLLFLNLHTTRMPLLSGSA